MPIDTLERSLQHFSMAETQQVPTLRQERLAAALMDPKIKTKKEAALKAGYSLTTATKVPGKVIDGLGTQNAVTALAERRRDKARGLAALGEQALAKPGLIDELEPRDRLAFGIQALKTANELGIEPARGDAVAFRIWKREHIRRLYPRLYRMQVTGIGPLGWRAPQHVVVSQEERPHYQEKVADGAP